MDLVVLVVLVVELAVAGLLLLRARRIREKADELAVRQRELEDEIGTLPVPTSAANPVLTVEILNALEVAANQSWAARTFGSLVPRLIVREVAARAAEQMGRQLTAQGVKAEVRVVAPAVPEKQP